ncbi:MAG: glycosyl hydrolase 53 family protein [Saprospiraceae bacterium]
MIRSYQYCLLLVICSFGLILCKKDPEGGDPHPDPMPNPTTPVQYIWDKFVMGADLSYVNIIQDQGGQYQDSGQIRDPYKIFKSHGANLVRIRLWHTPTWQSGLNNGKIYNDLNDVVKSIRRAKEAGMAVNLDLHYSDRWADPGTQETPAAWKNLNYNQLKDSVYNYTSRVLLFLQSQSLVPEIIQIGNETNQGMLFPLGKVVNNNFQPFADLLKQGISAVRDFSKNSTIKPLILLHVAQLQNAEYWTNGVVNLGGVTDFDILGLSHYFNWSTISTLPEVTNIISSLKTKYGKKIMIAETAYPWTNKNADTYSNIIPGDKGFATYGVSDTSQLNYMKDLTQAVIAGGGTGIMYWEPGWITSNLKDGWGTGSSWDNNTFFDFQGKALPVFQFMTYPYKF